MRPVITATTWGFCYLLHFSAPLGNLKNVRAQAQHYIGFAADDGSGVGLEHRIAEHLAGDGARITKAALANGIAVELVAAWHAPLSFEKRLKARKEAPRLCPVCCRAKGRKVKRADPLVQLALELELEEPAEAWIELEADIAYRLEQNGLAGDHLSAALGSAARADPDRPIRRDLTTLSPQGAQYIAAARRKG